MIASITRGASFRGLLAYVLDPKHQPALVGSNMFGQDPAALAAEFGAILRERRERGGRQVDRPVFHVALSFSPEDRRLSHADLDLIAEQFVARMGYEPCQYVAVEHNDRNHQHLHLVVSRVRSDGSLVREELGDYQRAMRICRELEREHGLTEVVARRGLHQSTKDEYRDALRAQRPSERTRLQGLVLTAVAGGPTLTEFVQRLEAEGVQVRLLRADDGPVLGISFRLERFAFRGAALGPRFTWGGLQREGLSYDPRRDKDVVERIGRQAAAAPGRARTRAEQLSAARSAIDAALVRKPTLERFASALDRRGVGVRLNVARTGHVSGISYVVAGMVIKGSDLGRDYSWHAIRRRGLRYDPQRDGELAHRLSGHGSGGGGSSRRPPLDPATERTRSWLEHDEARRLTPEYQQELLAKAPKEAFVRERGEVRASRSLDNHLSVEQIRNQTLSSARQFADEPQTPGLSMYPLAGYVEPGDLPPAAQLTHVDGYALVWRDRQSQVVGAAFVDGCTRRLTVPVELRKGFHDQLAAVHSDARAEFTRFWAANHHRLEGGDVGGIAIDDKAFDRDLTRQAVREIQTEMARHRVDRRLPFEKDKVASSLTTEGARSLKGQVADLQLTSAIAQAAVRNPDALQRLVAMPDTGRPLTRAELLRGVMDVAEGGGRQFHIEALAVKRAMRPLAYDPDAFRAAFGFDLAALPPQPIIVLDALPDGHHELHFEDVFGKRLEEHNARVVESQGRARDEGVHREAGSGGERAPGQGPRGDGPGRDRDHEADARAGTRPSEAVGGAALPHPTPATRTARPEQLARAQAILAWAVEGRPSLTAFIERAESRGLAVRLHRLADGEIVGISYRLGDVAIRAAHLGDAYCWRTLVTSSVSLDAVRDRATLERVGRLVRNGEAFRGREHRRIRRKPTDLEAALVTYAVRSFLAERPTFTTFVARLQASGIGVRLYYLDSRPLALSYELRGIDRDVLIRARELGPGHRWGRLLREGLDFDPRRDAATIAQVMWKLDQRPPARLEASDRDREHVRHTVREALVGGATLTQFVERVEARGVEVRLYRDEAGPVYSIGYGLPNAFIRGSELGPGHRWARLLREGLDFDPTRDAEALRKVGEAIAKPVGERPRPEPTQEQLATIRQAVRSALGPGATLTGFVERVEARDIEVRLYRDDQANVVAIGYALAGVSVAGKDLGPGHSWARLLREGLDFDAARDAEAIRKVGETLPAGEWRPPQATDVDLAFLRETLRDALAGRPTLSDFVSKVEASGVEVRLYRDDRGDIYAIGFGLGRLHVSGHELGPGFSWTDLQQRGLSVDPLRDREAIDRASETLTPSRQGFHSVLHAADRLAYAARTFRRSAQFVEELVEDPAAALGRAATRAAWRFALRGLTQLVHEASQSAAERNTEQNDRALLEASGRTLGQGDERRWLAADRSAPEPLLNNRSAEENHASATRPAPDRDARAIQPKTAEPASGSSRSLDAEPAPTPHERTGGHRQLAHEPRVADREDLDGHDRAHRADSQRGHGTDREDRGRHQDAAPGGGGHRGPAPGGEAGGHRVPTVGEGVRGDGRQGQGVPELGERRGDQGRGGARIDRDHVEGIQGPGRGGSGDGHGRQAGDVEGGRELQGRSGSSATVVHQDASDPPRPVHAPGGELAAGASAREPGQRIGRQGRRDDVDSRSRIEARDDTARPAHATDRQGQVANQEPKARAMETASTPAAAPSPAALPARAEPARGKDTAEHARQDQPNTPRQAAQPTRADQPSAAQGLLERLTACFKSQPAAAAAQKTPDAEGPEQLVRAAAERFRVRQQAQSRPAEEASPKPDAAEVVRAAAERFKRSIGVAADPPRQEGHALAAGAKAGADVLSHLPHPSRLKDLSESPEKAVAAGITTAAAIAVPKAAPVIGAAANAVEKQVERAQEPDRLP